MGSNSWGTIPDLFLFYAIILSINSVIVYWFGKRKRFPVLSFSLFAGSALTVFLYYFYIGQKESEWNIVNRLSFMEVIIALVSSVLVIWGGYLALKQIKESVYTNKIAAQTNKYWITTFWKDGSTLYINAYLFRLLIRKIRRKNTGAGLYVMTMLWNRLTITSVSRN